MSQRTSHTILAALAIATTLIAAPAFAAPAAPAAAPTSGFYVGAGLGYQQSNTGLLDDLNNSKAKGSPDYSASKSGMGGKIYGGYQFNENFAVEGNWTNLGTYKVTGNNIDEKLSSWGVGVSAVGIAPIDSTISLLGKVGVMYKVTSEDGSYKDKYISSTWTQRVTGAALSLGLGMEYQLDKNVALRLEYDYLGKARTSKDRDVDLSNHLISAGIRYRF